MNPDWFGILQQLFRGDAQGLANRRRFIDTLGKYPDDFADKPAVSDIEPAEDLSPAHVGNAKKKRLREAYLLGEIFAKPASMREDKE